MRKTTRLKKPQIPELDTLYRFDDLGGRPKYGGVEMTSATNIPSFDEIRDETHSMVVAEATARDDADDALQAQIDSLDSDLAAETTAREAADQAEATARANADQAEATARTNADANLQTQIDAIVASSDVKDIVGTYAELQAYDTSTLGDNDIIKVLQDETHQDETTYYRWVLADEEFSLIGEEGPYYTKAATDALLNTKADKATTYTKTEVDTALNGKVDKTSVVQATGQSTTNVMSQKAVTDAIKDVDESKIFYFDVGNGDHGFEPGDQVATYKDVDMTIPASHADLFNAAIQGSIVLIGCWQSEYEEGGVTYYKWYKWMAVSPNLVVDDGMTEEGYSTFFYLTDSTGRNLLWNRTGASDSNLWDVSNETVEPTILATLSYGSSTWNDFINAYRKSRIVYCRASSATDPSSGSQTRLAFMAYVNNPTNPTEVEFQYVRSVSTKSATNQTDQVFVYKLTNASGGTWTVETRNMAANVAAGTNAERTYSNGTVTINPRLYTTTGQNTNGGITQKLFTDTVGNIEAALNAINNGGNA